MIEWESYTDSSGSFSCYDIIIYYYTQSLKYLHLKLIIISDLYFPVYGTSATGRAGVR